MKIKIPKRKCLFVKVLEDFEPYKKDYAIEIEKNGRDIDYKIKSLIQPSKPKKRLTQIEKEAE